MKVLIDTCVWSLALRRQTSMQDPVVRELGELISESRAQFTGPVRQELLSGIKNLFKDLLPVVLHKVRF